MVQELSVRNAPEGKSLVNDAQLLAGTLPWWGILFARTRCFSR